MNGLSMVARQPLARHGETEPAFPPGVLFLSVTGFTAADSAAGGREPIKIGLQRDAGYRTALQRGIGIVKEFVEIGASANSLRTRPALRRLLAYLGAHPEISHVIFPGPHRFARTRQHAALLNQHFTRLNVLILIAGPDPHLGVSARTKGGRL
ncbi:recombinase family protein [Nocardia farcinica]|uniref:recombinase family protein n=1 Tax=Nocardia farcinica TaxID=37329 RepID=UPI00245667C7|nr:recombinase family protein [Nocardia farcinica]